jgi:hypothetical protein
MKILRETLDFAKIGQKYRTLYNNNIMYLTANGLSRNKELRNLSREGYMKSMQLQLGVLGTISAFAYRQNETKKNLCRGGRSQDMKT